MDDVVGSHLAVEVALGDDSRPAASVATKVTSARPIMRAAAVAAVPRRVAGGVCGCESAGRAADEARGNPRKRASGGTR